MTIVAKDETLENIRIKNPCIEEFIPLTIEKSDTIISKDIDDVTINSKATLYKATIKLGDDEIGEFQTRYVAHCGTTAGALKTVYTKNFPDPLKNFTVNSSVDLTNSFRHSPNNRLCKLVKDGEDYVFKYCDINGQLNADENFHFPSQLINFNKEYVKNLSDLEEGKDSMYVMTKSKLSESLNNIEDNLQIHPVEIREYHGKTQDGTIKSGKLIGTINHEYGLFRDSIQGEKSEFIFSDFITKGKDVRITDKDCVINPENECKIEPEGFLFLAKIKDTSDYPNRSSYDCREYSYNDYNESKLGEYVLGFANNRGCTKIISNTHLYEKIDLESLFGNNYDKAINVSPFMADMHDLYDLVQCATDPVSSSSMFI